MAALPSQSNAQWSSRFAFIMAAVGSSVGLGNLWRFSAEAGQSGGGAFIMIYLSCVILIGIPVLMSEYIIGRAGTASSAIESVNDVADKSGVSRRWNILGFTGMAASFLIVSFYCVIAAWVMMYIPKFLGGSFSGQTAAQIGSQFDTSAGVPMKVLPYFTAFVLLTVWLVSRGVQDGIELAAKVLMPLFFVLLFLLAIYSLWTGFATEITVDGVKTNGTSEALKFLYTPDFNAITPEIATAALGQAFFSIGLGSAIMITYGSYLPKSINIPKSAIVVALTDTGVALIAGLAIFPIVFSYGLDVAKGGGLFFNTLPVALSSAPGGNLIGAAFFFLALFAAVTSSVSLFEPTVAYVVEKAKVTRREATFGLGFFMWAIGVGAMYSPGDEGFLGFIDGKLTGAIMLPLTGLLTVLFVGWRMKKALVDEQMAGTSVWLRNLLFLLVRYVAPIFVLIVLIFGIDGTYFNSSLAELLHIVPSEP